MPMFEVISINKFWINATFLPLWIFKQERLILRVGNFSFIHIESVNIHGTHRLCISALLSIGAAHLKLACGDENHPFRGRRDIRSIGAINLIGKHGRVICPREVGDLHTAEENGEETDGCENEKMDMGFHKKFLIGGTQMF